MKLEVLWKEWFLICKEIETRLSKSKFQKSWKEHNRGNKVKNYDEIIMKLLNNEAAVQIHKLKSKKKKIKKLIKKIKN
jgi:hypothetical protein